MADNKKIAEDVLAAIGGKENVTQVTHCMTRLRFNLKDEGIPEDEKVKEITGVLGVAKSGGQYQVIIGQNVPKVYAEVCTQGGFQIQDEVNENLDTKKEKVTAKSIGNGILNYLAGSLTPLIPVIMAACLFKTVLAILGPDLLGLFTAESDIYKLLDFVYDAGFYFFPILLGFTAAKKLGANQMLGAYLGAILIVPDFMALVGAGESFSVFGIPCSLNDYSQSVLPAILSVWIMSYVEKFFKKYLPDVLQTIFTPFLTILVMTPIALCALAPAGAFLGNYICIGLLAFDKIGGFVAVALVAALWEILVMGGMHILIVMMLIQMLMENGFVEGAPVAGMYATFAVFGVALGAALRMKNKDEKSLAFGSFVGGILGGVTEPTLYGLCFSHKRCFIGLMGGAAIGGIYGGLTHVKMYVFGGSNFLSLIGFSGGSVANLVNGILACVISLIAAAILTFFFGFSKEDKALIK